MTRLLFAWLLLGAGCASAPAQGGRPNSPAAPEPAPSGVVAIDEPGEAVGVDEDQTPAPSTKRGSLEGDWIEDWPDRGGCADKINVREARGELELTGVDCNDGEAYKYFDVAFDGRTLKFKLKVKSTERLLEYVLELQGSGELVGPVTGATPATVTWRRAAPE